MEDKKPTMFGKLLNKVRFERQLAVDEAKRKMEERHGLKDYKARQLHEFRETRQVNRDGKEYIEIRLYKLVDAAVITIDSQVQHTIEGGISHLREFNNGE